MSEVKRIEAAVVDSSALLAVIFDDGYRTAFVDGLSRCDQRLMHEATLAEVSIAVIDRKGSGAIEALDRAMSSLNIQVVGRSETDEIRRHAKVFREGYIAFGKPPAETGLDIIDCFAYALAKELAVPLFYQGLEFSAADVKNAMQVLGYQMDLAGCPVMSIEDKQQSSE